MANYFAIKSGNWDDNTVWDSNIIPTSSDYVFANGYTVTINTDVDVNQLRNGSNNGQLPNMCVPVMTSNTTPSGVASASVNTASAWRAFGGGGWAASGSAYTLTYQFPTPKMIKRFRIVAGYNNTPNAFTFQGSNDPTFATIDFAYSATMPNAPNNVLISPLLNNLTSCLYYRINVTTSIGSTPTVYNFDMTESIAVTNSATGGYYLVSALPATPSTRTITLRDSTTGLMNASGNVNLLQVSATSGILNITHATMGNISYGGALIASQYNIYALPGCTCTININGNLYGDTLTAGGAARDNAAFGIAGAITTNIIGTLTAGNAYTNGSCAVTVLSTAGNAILNITGNLFGQSVNYGSGAGSATIAIQGSTNATLNITGNITANLFYAINTSTTYTGSINVLTGTVTSSVSAASIYNQGSGTVRLFSPVINANNNMAVLSQRIKLYSTAQVQWLFQNNAGTNTILYSAGASLGLPLTTNVRYPVQYGASNELTGQLIMPLPSNVRVGVPTDNTIGTGQLTAEDFLNAIAVSPNPVAERLRTTSTVDTTGDQMAAYNV